MAEHIITVENLKKTYKDTDKAAVDDVSFAVEKGSFFSLLGPNGAGKTTTISILTTLLNKTSGNVTVAGQSIDDDASHVRQNIGVIFQNPSLDQNLTAEENVRFHAALYGVYPFRPTYAAMPKTYKDHVMELASILRIDKDMFQPIKTFSGGMKRKLEIVRSLMHDPKVLFLDEPTSGLDPISRKSLWSYLKEVRENKLTTIFLTTHYLEEAEEADRVAIINEGKLVMNGTPEDMKKHLIDDFLELDDEDREGIIRVLDENKISYAVEDHIKISLHSVSAYSVIRMLNREPSYVNIHKPTLEEAYIELIEPDHD